MSATVSSRCCYWGRARCWRGPGRSHAIAEYAHDVGRAVLDVLGVGAVAPHESTIRRVLQRVDASALEAALQSWVLPQLSAQPAAEGTPRREQRRVLALDGKTLRGARVRAADGRVWLPHLVSVLDQTSGGVLGQVQVAEKGSEITAFTALLDPLDLDDVLVTADALHTQRAPRRLPTPPRRALPDDDQSEPAHAAGTGTGAALDPDRRR
ncbi:ISAs1 family transposase [Pseudonocardia sp. ICBG1142]|uniref:ISAs1 family transposase n=1 Tax=Pseudonocardia sp. ICBG1142 TaxID=2846760 RepID=UPI0035A83D2A